MNEKVICDNCFGRKYFRMKSNLEEYKPCPRCLGSGELDWLERLFGKRSIGRFLVSVHLEGKIFWVEPDHATGELREKVKHLMDVWYSKPGSGILKRPIDNRRI